MDGFAGTLLKFVDGNMTIEACIQTNQSVCEESIYIVTRNCDGYNVYYLRPTPANSSYCFGNVYGFLYISGYAPYFI